MLSNDYIEHARTIIPLLANRLEAVEKENAEPRGHLKTLGWNVIKGGLISDVLETI